MMNCAWSRTRWIRASIEPRSATYWAFKSVNSISTLLPSASAVARSQGAGAGLERHRRAFQHIAVAGVRTHRFTFALQGQPQALAVAAHPTDLPRRNTDDERKVRDVVVHHRASSYERMRADRRAADDRAVRAERRAAADPGWPVLRLALD